MQFMIFDFLPSFLPPSCYIPNHVCALAVVRKRLMIKYVLGVTNLCSIYATAFKTDTHNYTKT